MILEDLSVVGQTRIEERLEVIDQEIVELKELSKMPIIEVSLSEIAKNSELMRLQSEKQQQMLLMMMESNGKECSMMSERLTESDAQFCNGEREGKQSNI
ncbi:histone-lysine N-methyltransferase ASHR1 isoform X3 [Cucumis melo var. makuwa]|uniref:Histone-lysine N-methyltransferase ASHR1 isoform X3 n=1 Tax=Cucumis melo var. makuwa TaxID=1194695 RepID=A0A5A7VC54_CUCMM|nr:histone-lysine N-methyltransferase ASHR1 isoform X3 [Cucumis melo var. makuwa]TYK26164.1 histone-lysine N-methyltransferase ASHR1 isoform X3 [Cucumis melo var. makuwa]